MWLGVSLGLWLGGGVGCEVSASTAGGVWLCVWLLVCGWGCGWVRGWVCGIHVSAGWRGWVRSPGVRWAVWLGVMPSACVLGAGVGCVVGGLGWVCVLGVRCSV